VSVHEPTAFLFRNGGAAFTDEAGQQLGEFQRLGWCGLRLFLARYPGARVCIQGCDRLEPELVPWVLRNLRDTPEEVT
jgi:hypothetical protein